jgi:hypothetical protein
MLPDLADSIKGSEMAANLPFEMYGAFVVVVIIGSRIDFSES